jgi:hypothetical protein
MSQDPVDQLTSRLTGSLVSCGLSGEASAVAVTRLGELLGSVHPQSPLVDALDTGHWLDWLKHRADVWEAVNVAVLVREISRAGTVDVTPCLSEFIALLRHLKIPRTFGDVIERLVALPGSDTFWLPSSADEAVLLDAERSWFGDPVQGYRKRVATVRALSLALSFESWSAQRLENLTRILDSGLIFFLPETRCALEGRACLNLWLEIEDLKNGPS